MHLGLLRGSGPSKTIHCGARGSCRDTRETQETANDWGKYRSFRICLLQEVDDGLIYEN
jgi:hypothetical protein